MTKFKRGDVVISTGRKRHCGTLMYEGVKEMRYHGVIPMTIVYPDPCVEGNYYRVLENQFGWHEDDLELVEGAEMTKEKKFKVGDKVRMLGNETAYNKSIGYNTEMARMAGKTMTISKHHDDDGYWYVAENCFVWSEADLELVSMAEVDEVDEVDGRKHELIKPITIQALENDPRACKKGLGDFIVTAIRAKYRTDEPIPIDEAIKWGERCGGGEDWFIASGYIRKKTPVFVHNIEDFTIDEKDGTIYFGHRCEDGKILAIPKDGKSRPYLVDGSAPGFEKDDDGRIVLDD